MTDRLSLANALADAKIDRPAAERIATEIFDAIHENVATKADIATLRAEMTSVRTELKADIATLRGDMTLLRTELKADIAALEHRLSVRFASVMVVLTGVILAAIRYLPPAH